jgi:NADH-quinone oxidoreductase subunit L
MLINRIGDFFLLLGIFCIYIVFDTLNYDIVFTLAPFFKDFYFLFCGTYFSSLQTICLFLFLGAMGKSAQIGLHV